MTWRGEEGVWVGVVECSFKRMGLLGGRARRYLLGFNVAEHGDLLLDRVLQRRRAATHDLWEATGRGVSR